MILHVKELYPMELVFNFNIYYLISAFSEPCPSHVSGNYRWLRMSPLYPGQAAHLSLQVCEDSTECQQAG